MKKFKNPKKDSFLSKIITSSIDNKEDILTKRCKFNFHYMDFTQSAGQKFEEWNHDQLVKFLDKLKNYSEQSLNHWMHVKQRTSSHKRNHHVLEVYGDFPRNSEFIHPKHVPHQARWARFRLESEMRLIGFIIPDEFHYTRHPGTDLLFDCNTFYVVFLDKKHKFYITKK